MGNPPPYGSSFYYSKSPHHHQSASPSPSSSDQRGPQVYSQGHPIPAGSSCYSIPQASSSNGAAPQCPPASQYSSSYPLASAYSDSYPPVSPSSSHSQQYPQQTVFDQTQTYFVEEPNTCRSSFIMWFFITILVVIPVISFIFFIQVSSSIGNITRFNDTSSYIPAQSDNPRSNTFYTSSNSYRRPHNYGRF